MAVVVITGCSTGFGRAAALAFAEAGHTVVATMRDLAKADGLGQVSPLLTVCQLDVVDADSRRAAVLTTLERHGRIDVLVNNAGISSLGPAEEMPDTIVRAMFETNFFGPFALIKDVLPSMVHNDTGRIVNVTSIGALLSSGFYSVYCSTKHALDALTMGIDIELQQFGIRAVSVVPGGFNTSIVANRIAADRPETLYPRAKLAIEAYEERVGTRNDLTPVTEAIIEASTAAEPAARYLVGEGTTELLVGVVAEGERIHQVLRDRDAPEAR